MEKNEALPPKLRAKMHRKQCLQEQQEYRMKCMQEQKDLASRASSFCDANLDGLSVHVCMQDGICIKCREADVDGACFQPQLGCRQHDGRYNMHVHCFLDLAR